MAAPRNGFAADLAAETLVVVYNFNEHFNGSAIDAINLIEFTDDYDDGYDYLVQKMKDTRHFCKLSLNCQKVYSLNWIEI